MVQAAEQAQWPDDRKARHRARKILLEADVALVALQLADAPDKPLTVAALGRFIAEDGTPHARDRARKRVVNRIVETMEQYRLIRVSKIQVRRTMHYQLFATDELLALFRWLQPNFPLPPRISSQGEQS
jgi:hypothetical protein